MTPASAVTRASTRWWRRPAGPGASCPTTRGRPCWRRRCGPGGPARVRVRWPPSWRSAPGAASPPCTWERRPRRPEPSCSASTTTAAPRRTRRAGITTMPTWSTRVRRPDRHPPPLAAGGGRRPARRRGGGRGRRLADRGRPLGAPRSTSASSTAGTATSRPGPTTRGWAPHVVKGGWLAIHDVFPDPADGGRPPYELWCAALASGQWEPDGECGSLRILRRIALPG